MFYLFNRHIGLLEKGKPIARWGRKAKGSLNGKDSRAAREKRKQRKI